MCYRVRMDTEPTPPPLRAVLAENIRVTAARMNMKITDLASALEKDRSWVERRWHAKGPSTTEDVDLIAAALGVSTDELTRRAS